METVYRDVLESTMGLSPLRAGDQAALQAYCAEGTHVTAEAIDELFVNGILYSHFLLESGGSYEELSLEESTRLFDLCTETRINAGFLGEALLGSMARTLRGFYEKREFSAVTKSSTMLKIQHRLFIEWVGFCDWTWGQKIVAFRHSIWLAHAR